MRKITLLFLTFALVSSITDTFAAEYPYKHVEKRCSEARSQAHCMKVAKAIATAESSMCKNARNNNCWGFRNKKYESPSQAFDVWFKSYDRWWINAKSGKFFYWPHRKWTSYYCVDEVSSGTHWWCPNGRKIFDAVFFSK